jgi:serine/threonine-protein phosphatase 2A regulatory subunit A
MDTAEDGEYSIAELAQLIDNIKHIDPDARLASVRELTVISAALGPERTRQELLPFLRDSMDDEDDVLVAMAEELKKFVPLVGGPSHAHILLTEFEELASAEEGVVRERAIQGMNHIAPQLSPEQLEQFYLPLLSRLSRAPWFTTKSTACGLFATVYLLVPTAKRSSILSAFKSLAEDTTPMVRRAAATAMQGLSEMVDALVLKTVLLPMIHAFAKDEQDSVRLLAANLCCSVAKRVSKDEFQTLVLPVFGPLAKDESWRTRFMVADIICQLQSFCSPETVASDILPAFLSFLADPEPEVRTAISKNVLEFSKNLPMPQRSELLITHIIPSLSPLVTDESEYVRSALALVIMGLAALLGKTATIESLLPMFLLLLKDDCSEVRLNIISHLEDVNKVIGIGQLSQSLLPAIYELAKDPSWRVREAIIEHVPLVSKQLGVKFFNEELLSLCIDWLKDPVYAVRKAATLNVRNLVVVFDADWAKTTLLAKVLEMASDANFVNRMTLLFTINLLTEMCSPEIMTKMVSPAVCALHKDKIPNVRFNVARTLEQVAPLIDASVVDTQFRPVLMKLVNDTDRDVKFYAKKALLSIDAVHV